MTLKLPSAPSSNPTALTVRVAREAGGAAVGEAAGPQGSRPAPPHQLSRQVSQEDKGPLSPAAAPPPS